jgi:hypothetical protein
MQNINKLNFRCSKYERLVIYTDTHYEYTLSYEHEGYSKTVIIDNYDLDPPKARNYYPRELIELMEYIKALRKKYFRLPQPS